MSIFFVQYCHPSARILDRFEKPEPCIFTYPPHPVSFASGSVTRPCLLALISSLRKIPARPSRPFLGHMDPSFPIEKHFVLPRMLYAGCQHILSSIASYYTSTRTDTASKVVTRTLEQLEGGDRIRITYTEQGKRGQLLTALKNRRNKQQNTCTLNYCGTCFNV